MTVRVEYWQRSADSKYLRLIKEYDAPDDQVQIPDDFVDDDGQRNEVRFVLPRDTTIVVVVERMSDETG